MSAVRMAADAALLKLRESFEIGAVYAFVDPTLHNPIEQHGGVRRAYDELCRRGLAKKVPLPFIHENFDPDRNPFLLWMSSEGEAEPLFNATVAQAVAECLGEAPGLPAEVRSICGWFASKDAPALVAQQLACAARIVKPDGNRWYLRYWDPRVIWQLPRVLRPDLLRRLCAALPIWYCIDPGGRLARFVHHDSHVVSNTSVQSPIGGTLAVSDEEWKGLVRIGMVNRVLNAIQGWAPEFNDGIARRIERAFDRCVERGFTMPDDQVTFGCASLVSHDRFDEHPQVDSALRQATTVAAAVASFDDSFWAGLSTGEWLDHLK